ncbi:MAG TPA: sulfatase-like hydrolase/transferase, partial [Candidatus Limnocylindrales bacterium]|nr:sulfatase-like hydrolase/transferase [Candidatus Limnocylindrales bacterium]
EAIWYGYDNELAYMDAQVGRLVQGLRQRKLLDDAIVVVVGDHGEGLMEHGEKSHGAAIFQELMLVPLIIVLPDGTRAGTRVAAPVQMQDLLPTLLDLVGIADAGGSLPGLDLAPGLREGGEPAARPVFVERPYYSPEGIRGGRALAHGWGFGELAGVIVGDDKLVRLPRDAGTGKVAHQLFDLASDPDELRDISADHAGCVAKLSAQLDEWLRLYPVGEEVVAPTLSPERREQLQALGYIQGEGGEEAPSEGAGAPAGGGSSPWGPLDPSEAPTGPGDCQH